jgi:Protein of unknown function (DUF4435)
VPDEQRRTLEELVARYELEPELRDIYVEGYSDYLFFQWFLDKSKCQNSAVYEIDTVQIAEEILVQHGLDNGNRGRVIALALELERKLVHPHQATCVADRDFDAITGRTFSCGILLFTDYSCLEMYTFNECALSKFLSIVVRTSAISARQLLASLYPILQEVFLIRLTSIKLQLALSWISFTKCCTAKRGNIEFNAAQFIRNYLTSNSAWDGRDQFLETLTELRQHLTDDYRHHIRGHDYVEILSLYMNSISNKRIFSDDVIARSIMGVLEYDDLKNEHLFNLILTRSTN